MSLRSFENHVCTWRHGGHVGGQEQKYFSPLGTKRYFHVNFSCKISILLNPNMAALSRGCKPRIGVHNSGKDRMTFFGSQAQPGLDRCYLNTSKHLFASGTIELSLWSLLCLWITRRGASYSVVLSKINMKSVLFFTFGVFAVFHKVSFNWSFKDFK